MNTPKAFRKADTGNTIKKRALMVLIPGIRGLQMPFWPF